MKKEPIGRVLILGGHGIATLLDRDKWEVVIDGDRDPEFEKTLVDRYQNSYAGPQDGTYGVWILNDLAKAFDTIPDIMVELSKPGLVY